MVEKRFPGEGMDSFPGRKCPVRVVDLFEASARIPGYWSPKIVAGLNGQHVKLARFKGTFVRHRHEEEDELFLVLEGSFSLRFWEGDGEERAVSLERGEMAVVPRGVDHMPAAEEEALVLLFEPAGILDTGNVGEEPTLPGPDRVRP